MARTWIPAGLKRRILPFYNGVFHAARRAGEYLGALRHGRFGQCAVCGRFAAWLYRRRVVPTKLEERWGLTPALAEALARKESSDCSRCGAKLRARRLAAVLIELYGNGSTRSVREWVGSAEARVLRVAEINRIEGLHEVLADLPRFLSSDFAPGAKPGEIRAGVRSEDLASLTYGDESLDLVLTSETLEHVSDLEAALGEIRRVLAPGGRHIFTVPLLPGVPETFARMVVLQDGTLEHRALEICHPGGDVGYPVFTEFGSDFPEILRRAGFEVDVHFGPVRETDIAQVFVTRKPL